MYVKMLKDFGSQISALKSGMIVNVNNLEAQHLVSEKFAEVIPSISGTPTPMATPPINPVSAKKQFDAVQATGPLFKAISGPGGTTGGYLVPEELFAVFQMALYASPFMQYGNVVNAIGSAKVSVPLPYVDTTSGDLNFFGQFSATWTPEETITLTESEPKFANLELLQKTLNSYSYTSNTLLQDSNFMGEMFDKHVINAIRWQIDRAFLIGNGPGQPLGALTHPLAIKIDRNTTNEILEVNVGTMLTRLLCNDWTRAFWVAHPATLSQLAQMTYLFHGKDGEFQLAGLPLCFHPALPTLGSLGDLILFSGEYFLCPFFELPRVVRSEHPKFISNQTVLKAQTRLNGGWLLNAVVNPANGNSLSPIVILDVHS